MGGQKKGFGGGLKGLVFFFWFLGFQVLARRRCQRGAKGLWVFKGLVFFFFCFFFGFGFFWGFSGLGFWAAWGLGFFGFWFRV